MALGGKTVTKILAEIGEDPNMTTLDCTNNASMKMKSTEGLQQLCEALKAHKSIKVLIFNECEIIDAGCEVIAEVLKVNHVIEELHLEKNKITSVGACSIADALLHNKGLRTLNLMQQSVQNFGEETLERFITMFGENITLTKIQWRLTSRKSFMLNKCQTRNVEIKKRKDKGEDFNSYLPDHLKTGAPAPAEAASSSAPTEDQESPDRKRSSVVDVEAHLAAVETAVGELQISEKQDEEVKPDGES